jgi:hypothetical protein
MKDENKGQPGKGDVYRTQAPAQSSHNSKIKVQLHRAALSGNRLKTNICYVQSNG